MNEHIIRVENLNKQFIVDKKPIEVLRNINLEIDKGEFITIVGHSGCGKSTLLKIMCGLVASIKEKYSDLATCSLLCAPGVYVGIIR